MLIDTFYLFNNNNKIKQYAYHLKSFTGFVDRDTYGQIEYTSFPLSFM